MDIVKKKIYLLAILFFILWASDARADSQWQTSNFNIDAVYDTARRNGVSAVNLKVSQKAYFYIETSWWDKQDGGVREETKDIIANLAVEFDQKIYPTETSVFGSEWIPGIDNDPKLTILFTQIKGEVGGYFNSGDEASKKINPFSNEREMIYVNISYLKSPRIKSFIAHESQHLITFYQKEKLRERQEDIWLNEARSEYVPTLLGYDNLYANSNLEKRVTDFLKTPSDSLTDWQNGTADYASVNLFMQYLVSHYGTAVLTKMMQSSEVGILSINSALSSLGVNKTFADVFTDWTIANYLNDCSISPSKLYCYTNPNLGHDHLKINLDLMGAGNSFEIGYKAQDWAGYWYRAEAVRGEGKINVLNIKFSSLSNKSNFKVSYIIVYENGKIEISFLNLNKLDPGQEGAAYIPDFGGSISSVVVIPSNQYRVTEFDRYESSIPYSLDFSTTKEMPILNSSYPDGSLIRAKGDYKVYVINGKYRRWIQNPEIFSFYGHFKWASVIEVTPQERDSYQESWLVRADGDYKVYEINGDGTRHWLNITAEQFSISGRKWDMVFIINKRERDWYKLGVDVKK